MHDIWNPWHGCKKCSEGCQNCYMYFLDEQRGKNGADIYRTKSGFRYPLSKDRQGRYKVQSGEQLRVCMTSDFFPSASGRSVLSLDEASRKGARLLALRLGRRLGKCVLQRQL